MLKPSSTTGQRQRKEEQQVSQTSPGQRSPQGPGVSVPDCRKGSPTFPRRRQEVCAGADRPAEHFFFSTGRGAFSFDVFMRGPRRAPRGGERRSKGAGAVFAAGGNRAERTLRRRQWGAHPAWTMPLREQNPRGQPPAAWIHPQGEGHFPIIPSPCFQVSTRRQAVSMVSSDRAPLSTASMTLGICVR